MSLCFGGSNEVREHCLAGQGEEAEGRLLLRCHPQRLGFRLRFAAARLFVALLITIFMAATAAVAAQSDLKSLLEQARTYENGGDYAAAERVYEQALALAPENLETLKRLGVLQQTELKFGDSIELFHRVLARDAQYPETNFFLGVSYFGEKDFAQAIQSFERELTTPNPHPRCRYYLGLALQSSGRIDEATSQLNRVVAEKPKDADALYQLARIYKNASIQAIERLKTLDQDSFQLHALMGEAYADEDLVKGILTNLVCCLALRQLARGLLSRQGPCSTVLHP